jgi:hypothetical protein
VDWIVSRRTLSSREPSPTSVEHSWVAGCEEVDDFESKTSDASCTARRISCGSGQHKYDLRHLMRTILNSRAYQLFAEPNAIEPQ